MNKKVEFYIEYNLGDKVYLDLPDSEQGIVTDIEYNYHTDKVIYYVTWAASNVTRHYGFELSRTKSF